MPEPHARTSPARSRHAAPIARRLRSWPRERAAPERDRRASPRPARPSAALPAVDEHRRHRRARRGDRHRRHAHRASRSPSARGARRRDSIEPPSRRSCIAFPDDEPAAVAGAEPCTAVTVLSSFENAEMVANLAAGYNAQPRDINGSCVTVTPVTRQVRRRRRGRRGRIPRPRARAAADRLAPGLRTPGCRWPGRTAARRRCPPSPRASARPTSCWPCPSRSPRRSAGTRSRRAGGDVFDAAGDADLWERPRPPRVGRASSSARRARSSRHPARRRCSPRSALPRARSTTLTAASVADPSVQGHRARARTRHEPLHGDPRALPLARPPGRADRLGRRLPLGRHRRREVGVGLQPRHHEPRRRDPHDRRAAGGEARARSIRPTASTSPTTPPSC